MATGDMTAIPAMAGGFVSLFGRIEKGTGDTLHLPGGMVNIGGNGQGYTLADQANWDPVTNNDGSFTALALGDDIYLYATQHASGVAQIVASKNSTVPTGYTSGNSRKIGGFHFGRVRAIADAYSAAATVTTQIIPNSVWDLRHRPKCDPTGFFEAIPGSVWLSIYLMSEDVVAWPDTTIRSAYGAVPLTGTEGYSYDDYTRMLRNIGCRKPTYEEMKAGAYGVPQGATGAASRQNTGNHAGYGFAAVSCLGMDQPAGNLYQVMNQFHDRSTGVGWKDDLNTGKDAAHDHGQWYGGEFKCGVFGGPWSSGAQAGARCAILHNGPWNVNSNTGVRAACDSL